MTGKDLSVDFYTKNLLLLHLNKICSMLLGFIYVALKRWFCLDLTLHFTFCNLDRWKHGLHYWIHSAQMGSWSLNSCTRFRSSAMRMQSWWSCSQKLWDLSMIRMCLLRIPFFSGFGKEQTQRAGMSFFLIFWLASTIFFIFIKVELCYGNPDTRKGRSWFMF